MWSPSKPNYFILYHYTFAIFSARTRRLREGNAFSHICLYTEEKGGGHLRTHLIISLYLFLDWVTIQKDKDPDSALLFIKNQPGPQPNVDPCPILLPPNDQCKERA